MLKYPQLIAALPIIATIAICSSSPIVLVGDPASSHLKQTGFSPKTCGNDELGSWAFDSIMLGKQIKRVQRHENSTFSRAIDGDLVFTMHEVPGTR